MVKYLGIRVTGAIVLAAYTAIDFALNAQGLGLGFRWLSFITLIVFISIVSWIMYDLKKANEHLLDSRPTIDVKPIKEGDTYYLLVTNNGAPAVITAQIKLESDDVNVSSLTKLSFYQGYWDTAEPCKAQIMSGQSAKIKVAEIISARPIVGLDMNIFYCTVGNLLERVHAMPYFIGATVTDNAGNTSPYPHPEDHRLLVTIGSTPELREGVFRQRYRLNYNKLILDTNS